MTAMSDDTDRKIDRNMELGPMQEESWVDRLCDETAPIYLMSMCVVWFAMFYWICTGMFFEWTHMTRMILVVLCVSPLPLAIAILFANIAHMIRKGE